MKKKYQKKKRIKKKKARPKGEPSGIGDILATLKETTELGVQIERGRIWEQWDEIVGKPYCEHGQPRSVKDQCLVVEADSAVWMHKFTYRKWSLIKAINRNAGQELVSDIFVTLVSDEDSPEA